MKIPLDKWEEIDLERAALEGGYRALLHILLHSEGRLVRLGDLFRAPTLDLQELRAEIATMSGGERRLLSVALSLYDGAQDLGSVGLRVIPLDEIVYGLAEEDLQLVFEAMLLRRGDYSARRIDPKRWKAAFDDAYRARGFDPPPDPAPAVSAGPFEAMRDRMEEYIQALQRAWAESQ